MFIILEMSLFCNLLSFFDVSVDVTCVFSEVKFLDCFHWFDGVFGTFHRFYKLNQTFILVFDFVKLISYTGVCKLSFT